MNDPTNGTPESRPVGHTAGAPEATPPGTPRTDIFPYFDGARHRWADPRRVQRLLTTGLGGQYHHLMGDLRESARLSEEARQCRESYEKRAAAPPEANHDPAPAAGRDCPCWTCRALQVTLAAEGTGAAASLAAWGAVGQLVPVVRETFGMAEFDPDAGTGATEDQCLDALFAFVEFQAGLKKNTAPPPTSPAPSATPPPPPSSGRTPAATSAPTGYG